MFVFHGSARQDFDIDPGPIAASLAYALADAIIAPGAVTIVCMRINSDTYAVVDKTNVCVCEVAVAETWGCLRDIDDTHAAESAKIARSAFSNIIAFANKKSR